MGSYARRVWRIDRAGSLDRLRLVDDLLPAPGAGQARIRIQSAGLNFADIFACLGLYSATPRGAFTPGLEFAGVVEETGTGTASFRPGDLVMGGIRFGSYASHLNADARYLYPLPDPWSPAEGAAFPVQSLTAWYALVELAAVGRGQLVLLHSAAGGVGLQALAMMRKLGVRAIATVGSHEKEEFLLRHTGLSAEQVIVRDARSFEQQLKAALSSAGVLSPDAVLDSVAGEYFEAGYRSLKPGGRLVLYGAASLMPAGKRPNYVRLAWRYLRRPRLDPLGMISENKSIMGFNLIWLWDQHERFRDMLEQILNLELPPPHIGARFPFEQAPRAMRHLQSGSSVGKVILDY